MKVKELLDRATHIYFAGYCSCGCGEACYDIDLSDGKFYPGTFGEEFLREHKPDLLNKVKIYDAYGAVTE